VHRRSAEGSLGRAESQALRPRDPSQRRANVVFHENACDHRLEATFGWAGGAVPSRIAKSWLGHGRPAIAAVIAAEGLLDVAEEQRDQQAPS
jgi:hypothetical protein